MAVNNISNLINQICSASGLRGKALDDLRVRLAKMSEAELRQELTKAIAGNNSAGNMGLEVERTSYSQAQTQPVQPQQPQSQKQIINEKQCKEVACQLIDQNLREALEIFNSQYLGSISGAYDNAKDEENKLKTSNVAKVLQYQQAGLTQIIEAKNQKLTRRQYYEENKQRIKDMILTRLNVLKTSSGASYIDSLRGKYSKDEMTEIINACVERLCSDASMEELKNIQLQFVSYNQEEETEALSNFVKKAKDFQENRRDTTINALENKGTPQIVKDPDKGIVPSYWDSDEPISFEEVYKLERGTEYSQHEVEKYVQAKAEMETVINAHNKKQQFVDFTDALRKEELSSAEKEEKLLAGYAEFYALSEDGGISELQKIINKSNLPIAIKDGKLDLSAFPDDAGKTRILNQLLKLAGQEKEKEFKTFLGDKTLEEYQSSFEETANDVLGEENSKLLANAMVNDNMGMIKRYTGTASMAGMALTVVGGILCFTPAAPLGAALVTAGNTVAIGGMAAKTGLGVADYATKDVQTKEELEDLAKDFIMDAGGFIIGMKAGQAGVKAFNKLIDKKLVAVFGQQISEGNKLQALKTVFANPEYLKSFTEAAGVKISTDFLISYMGDLAMMGILDTNDDWKSLLQANLTGILVGMSGDIKDVAGIGRGAVRNNLNAQETKLQPPKTETEIKPEADAPKVETRTAADTPKAPEFKELTDAEFEAMKPQIEAKLKERNINDVELNKNNIQIVDMIFSNEKLYNNENVMQNIGNIIYSTDTPEKAEIAKTILSNEKLYNNEIVMRNIGSIINITKTPEKAEIAKTILLNEKLHNNENVMQHINDIIRDAKIPASAEIAKTILSNEKLYNNENVTKNIGFFTYNTNSPERLEVAKAILSNEKLYNNENIMENIGHIIYDTHTPAVVKAKAEIMDLYTSNEKLYNNENVIKYIGGIMRFTDTPERLEIAKTILSNEKLYNNEYIMQDISYIIFCTDNPESVNAEAEIMNLYCTNEKLYNNENVMKKIGDIISNTDTPERAKARAEIINLYTSNEKLYNNKNVMENIGNILCNVESDNLPLAKQIFETEGLNPEKTLEILKSVELTDEINFGEIDVQKVRQYTSLLQDKKLSPFVVEHLNNGMDMNSAAFLAKTQKKINTENTSQEVKSQLGEDLQNSYDIFTSHGMSDKEAAAVVKAISQDGVPDIALQSVALDLMQKGIPANKIGDAIKNAKITGEFNQKIVDDFISLQDLRLNPLLEKNLAVLNNIPAEEVFSKFNSNVKKQIKAMLEKLTPEQRQTLAERGFDIDEINGKLDTKLVKSAKNTDSKKLKIQTGYRSKQNITGFEKVVIDKYNPDQKIWQNEQATRAWAEDKYNSIIGRDYKSTTYTDANEPRERGLKEWADFMATEPELKDNPFAKIILAEFITRDLLPENADIPPQLDKNLVKEILSSADKNTNFSKLYSDRLREKAMKNTMAEKVEVNGVKGTWYTVPQTDRSSPDYKTNVDKVKAFSDGTNWCIRTFNAEPYVEQGAMHFFVDENGLTQVCIRENRPGSVYEIQKRQQNATVPIAHIDVIDDYMTRNGLKAQDECQAKIETARRAKPEFDKLKAEFAELVKNKDYKSIFEKIGIKVKENFDGSFVLSHYDPEIKGFTLSDLGIKENDLLANVVKIEGDAKFKNSNATAAPRLREVGGNLDFEDSNLADVRSLKTINGKEINWKVPELPLNTFAKSMILKAGDKFYLKPEFERQVRDIAAQIRKTALDKENDIVDLMKQCGFEFSESKMRHRTKGNQSLYDKLKNYLTDGKNAEKTLNDAIKSVKDAVGTRTVLKNKDYTKHPEVAALLNAGKRQEAVLRAAELQSQEMFENFKAFLIKQKQNNTDISAIRVNNYVAKDGIPYLSERQLAELQDIGVASIKARIAPNDEKADLINDDEATTKIRESGYTAFQVNFVTKDGFVYEWQFRGEEVNRFAEGEHIPYDLRTNKDITSGNKDLELLYQPIKDLLNKDTMKDEVFNAYNKYLTAHYNYLREKELGFDTQKPNLEDFGNFDKRLRAENLEILHKIASQLKDGKISADEAVKQYASCII